MLTFDAKLSVRLGRKGEQSMSWIDDEAEKDQSQVTFEKYARETIQRSIRKSARAAGPRQRYCAGAA